MNTTTWIATAIGALFCYAVFLLVVFSILTVASRADDAQADLSVMHHTERDQDAIGRYPNADLPAAHPMTELIDE